MTDVAVSKDEKMNLFINLPVEAKLVLVYSTLLDLQGYVTDLEKKASAMTSPEALQGMMSSFMGGNLFG
jgi:hypothetical protein